MNIVNIFLIMAAVFEVVDTVLYADTVEWCKDTRYTNILACGTYQLIEDTGIRKGGVQIYELKKNNKTKGLHKCLSVIDDMTGVLDMRWTTTTTDNTINIPLLYTANADGNVRVYYMEQTHSKDMILLCKEAVPLGTSSDNVLICLSVDLYQNDTLVASDTRGCVTLMSADTIGVVRQWKGHAHEAWVATFCHSRDLILSGGDDCKLCLWDTRQDGPIAMKRHEMGVCCIQAHPVKPYLFASGSYDEIVTLWDQRNFHTPLQQLSVGGGVWRVKWHPHFTNLMAVASMHAGFHIIDWDNVKIVDKYNGLVSLGYGIDWYPGQEDESTGSKTLLLASCSFYDHSLHLWSCQV